MAQAGIIITSSRQDILLPPGSQTSGATALFIYSGEASCNFFSPSGTTVSDELQIFIEGGLTAATQIVGSLKTSPPVPIVLPTSWNSNGSNTVIAINSPALFFGTGGQISPNGSPLTGGSGLYIIAQVSVQHGSLLNVQYQVSVRVI
jgi:hypothetical protein